MIIILSQKADGSTGDVIEWLIGMKKKFIRVNSDDNRTKFVKLDLNQQELLVEQSGNCYNLFDAESYWYRRKGFSTNMLKDRFRATTENVLLENSNYVSNHVQQELDSLIKFMYQSLEKKCKTLGSQANAALNKLTMMEIAKSKGLDIPKSFVLSTRSEIIKILETENGAVITKALENGIYNLTRKYGYYSYTEKITIDTVMQLPERFFPSLIQLEIKKKYELRVFYLHGEFYSMAIFSQNDSQTAVDFRKYNLKKPNRTVPYKLPKAIEEKLHKIMIEIKLNTGSFDLIVNSDGRFVFLEVNPIGQFSMTSIPCNYYLDKKIAQIL